MNLIFADLFHLKVKAWLKRSISRLDRKSTLREITLGFLKVADTQNANLIRLNRILRKINISILQADVHVRSPLFNSVPRDESRDL